MTSTNFDQGSVGTLVFESASSAATKKPVMRLPPGRMCSFSVGLPTGPCDAISRSAGVRH